jgi:type IVB pilus formation R64 PilN family outer membrane protein
VVVKTTPNRLSEVDDFMKKINETMLRQVFVEYKVYSVSISNSEQYGLNWDAIYSSIGENLSAGFSSGVTSTVGAGNFAFNILERGNWAGTSAFIEALKTQGNVSQVTSSSATTLNHQPVPIQVGRTQAYLKSSSTTIIDTQTTTTLEPGTISTGFSMNMVPNIMNAETLLLQFGIDISSLIGIESISSGDSTIQTPEIESRNFVQRVKLNSGDTLIVSGFEQSNLGSKRSQVGFDDMDPNVNPLGGSTSSDELRTALVIVVQPFILD